MSKKNKEPKKQQASNKNDDKVELEGIVRTVNGDHFFVEVAMGSGQPFVVDAKPAGKLRQHSIMILPGDFVRLEVSPYDLTKGRIVYRNAGKVQSNG